MTDRPITFSATMVRALLDGRKSMTRRVLKPQPPCDEETGRPFSGTFCGPEWYTPAVVDRHGEEVPGKEVFGIYGDDWGRRVPYAPGDRLYVREAMHWTDNLRFVADDAVVDFDRMPEGFTAGRPHVSGMLMPRWASRLTLTVTEVRVQRLQEISEADAQAEGAPAIGAELCPPDCENIRSHQWGFQNLWNSLHGPDAWAANPWVVAVSFTTRKGNIDAPSAESASAARGEEG